MKRRERVKTTDKNQSHTTTTDALDNLPPTLPDISLCLPPVIDARCRHD